MYNFKFAENLENIPQEIIDQTNYIVEQSKNDEQIKVLSPQEPLHSCTMRQLDTRINLVHSRTLYTKKIEQEELQERYNLSRIYYGEYTYNVDQFYEMVNKHKIDWIIINKKDEQNIKYIEDACFSIDCEIGGYILYKIF